MSKRALHKDILMEIKKTRQRFLSIFFIVALGVAFFSGVRSSNPDMRLTADKYIDDHKLMDVRIISTLGFGEEDLEYIRQLEAVEEAEGSWFTDVICVRDNSQLVLQLLSAMEQFNQIEVTKGRMPVRETECLIDNRLATHWGLKVGDTLDLISGTEEDLEDTLTSAQLEVVGIGNHAGYIAATRGSSTIGDGEINGFVIVTPELFLSDVYTQICIRAEGSMELLSHSEEYDALIEKLTDHLGEIEAEQCQKRYDTVKNDITEALADARTELSEGRQEAEEKLADAEQQLLDAEQELEDGRMQLAEKEQELADGWAQLQEGETQLEQAKQELAAGEERIASGKTQIQTNELAIQLAKEQIAEGEYQLALLKAMYPSSLISIEEIDRQIAEGEQSLRDARAQMASAENQIASAKAEIQAGEAQMAAAREQIEAGEKEIEENRGKLTDGQAQLEEARKTLEEGEQELADGWKEYEEQKSEAEQKFADAEEEIADAEAVLADLKVPEWYILDRDNLPDFKSVGQNADRIGAIGKVFPVIFFIIAALVSLTTMTRMVEEQRTQIGTLKALGYSKWSIASKYVFYALAATLGGSILGVLVGEKLFPFVIIISYGILYLPLREAVCPYNMYYALIGSGLAIVCTLGATLFSCFRALQSVPASLMRPVSPKQGKRVLMEYIPFIWKRLNFGQKAAMRNLFRYKKRFFMTLFGIGSCMALLIVGFGLKDSIMNIASIQYSHIQLYHGMLQMRDDVTESERQDLLNTIEQMEEIQASSRVYMKNMEVTANGVIRDAYVCVPQFPEEFEKINQFRNRTTGEVYHLSDQGVIVTEQMAEALGVERGDTVILKSGENLQKEVVIADITENYMMHYVYVTPDYYESVFEEQPDYSIVLYQLSEDGISREKEIGEQILQHKAAYGITYVSDTKKTVEDMLGALNVVIIVLIVSAGLLAYIVVFNLNNINITERRRELATIKVLGFYDGEVAMYVYRENMILTVLGVITGAFLGTALHQFVIVTVEVDMVMFGRQVMAASYWYSALLTMLFAVLVNWIMFYKLKEINMVESLKSVE